MAHVVIIARVPDGLILSEAHSVTTAAIAEGRRQVSDLLRHLGSLSSKCSVECAGFVIHVSMVDGVCCLAMFDRSYPRNYAFAFHEEIQTMFQEELKRTFGTGSVDYRSHIDTIEKPYYFLSLDRQILKKVQHYRDPSSSQALSRLHAQLTQVSGIMQHNIDEILSRGESLGNISRKAEHLSYASLEFESSSKRLALHALCKKFGALLLLGLPIAALAFMAYRIAQPRMTSVLTLCLLVVATSLLMVCFCLQKLVLRAQRRRSSKARTDRYQFEEDCYVDSFA